MKKRLLLNYDLPKYDLFRTSESGVPERRLLRRGVFAFLITFWGGIRCENDWPTLCDVLRIFFEAFVHFPATRPQVARAGRKMHKRFQK